MLDLPCRNQFRVDGIHPHRGHRVGLRLHPGRHRHLHGLPPQWSRCRPWPVEQDQHDRGDPHRLRHREVLGQVHRRYGRRLGVHRRRRHRPREHLGGESRDPGRAGQSRRGAARPGRVESRCVADVLQQSGRTVSLQHQSAVLLRRGDSGEEAQRIAVVEVDAGNRRGVRADPGPDDHRRHLRGQGRRDFLRRILSIPRRHERDHGRNPHRRHLHRLGRRTGRQHRLRRIPPQRT